MLSATNRFLHCISGIASLFIPVIGIRVDFVKVTIEKNIHTVINAHVKYMTGQNSVFFNLS